MTSLIERLRRRKGGWASNVTYKDDAGPPINPDGPEAADALEALSAQLEAKTREADEQFNNGLALCDKLDALSAECEGLREVLNEAQGALKAAAEYMRARVTKCSEPFPLQRVEGQLIKLGALNTKESGNG